MAEPRPYPTRWEADVVLRDGATVHVRPIRPDDARRIEALHRRLSAETVYFRFFSPLSTLPPHLLARLVNVDYHNEMALVAELGDEVVAVAHYVRLHGTLLAGDEAEVAFLVDDAHQGRGLGTLLLEHLAVVAREEGIARFVADTLPDNTKMLRIFHEAGFGDERRFADGVVRVAFRIEPTDASLAAVDERERHATARSVRRLLHPESVAVVGANRRRGTVGRALLDRLLSSGFDGPIYPVNPEARHVASVRAYRSVLEIPDRVDLAVVAVPAASVGAVAEQCAQKHVTGLVVVSSGFAELGPAGEARERKLVSEARLHGMRLIGPNCTGVLNADPSVRLNATFSPMPVAGSLGLVAQPGGLGIVVLDEVERRGLGVSTFVSLGNKADVSSNDVLQYWDDDPATDVCAMYIETFGNPRVFARVARRVASRKPVVVVKSVRTLAGARAAGTGVLVEDDRLSEALFGQTGVIRTNTLEELFDVVQLLASQPLPPGPGVAIVGNTGGPSVLAADACSAANLEVVALDGATRARLAPLGQFPGDCANPVNLAPDAAPDVFRQAITTLLDDQAVCAVIALYTSPMAAPLQEVVDAITAARADCPGKPVLACILGRRGLLESGLGADAGGTSRPGIETDGVGRGELTQAIPSYAFPEAAARALGHAASYAAWRRRPPGQPLELAGVDVEAARNLVAAALKDAPKGWLSPAEVTGLLDAYGIAVVPAETASTLREATDAARRLGYPVAVKRPTKPGQTGPGRGGFRLDVANPAGVKAAFEELAEMVGSVVVQAMAGSGEHVVAGVVHDPTFGPTVTLGLGGRLGEPPQSVEGRVTPLTDLDTAELVDVALGATRPDGHPWEEAERSAVTDVVVRVGSMADDLPELVQLELNPVIVSSAGAVVIGGRARVAPWEPRPELALRRLS